MIFSRRPWRPRHLLLAWSAYWVGLILVTLSPALLAGWRLSRAEHGHGSAGAGVNEGMLTAYIVDSGQTMWSGSIPVFNLILLLCLPPLAIWIAWLLVSSRTNNADALRSTDEMRQKELTGSDRTPGMNESFSKPSMREKREES